MDHIAIASPRLRRRALLAAVVVPLLPAGPREPCCGLISANGDRLARFLDTSGVETHWIAGWHVNWRTGLPDRAAPGGPASDSHCSAFVAAIADRLGLPLLHPPEHRQTLLANAQAQWLAGPGAALGWRALGWRQAQAAANEGALVLAVFSNPDPRRPGHIAIVRPSLKDAAALERDGPQVIQAGEKNYRSIDLRTGFSHHPGAWRPGGGGAVRFYAHPLDWTPPPMAG
ncbi:MAG TPA: hypothetical protein VME92_20040 [Acetobacteraceae bacterium]|nr:hypothetical protein [Acetobacteraceae bacterium]